MKTKEGLVLFIDSVTNVLPSKNNLEYYDSKGKHKIIYQKKLLENLKKIIDKGKLISIIVIKADSKVEGIFTDYHDNKVYLTVDNNIVEIEEKQVKDIVIL